MAAAAALALATATAVPASSAAAGNSKLCLKNDSSECDQAQGTSNPMLTFHNGYTLWSVAFIGNYVMFTDGNGKCAHGTSNNLVEVSTACGPGNTASHWTEVTVNGHLAFMNVAYAPGLLEANCDGNGCDVILAPQGTPGDWIEANF
jgi:hypothetical protein